MSPSEVARALAALVPTRRPVYLWGPPGCAKSSVVRQTADALKLDLVDVRATLLDPVDLRGLPRVTRDAAVWCPPAFLPRAGNEGIREFWNTVSTLIDPIDPAMVRDFQHSTMARPVPVEFFETVVGESLKVPARVWKSALEPFLTINFAAELSEIDVPTVLIWGDRDAFTGRDEQDGIKGAISGSSLVTYVGVGHCPHWEEPERFAAQVVEFVKDLEQF